MVRPADVGRYTRVLRVLGRMTQICSVARLKRAIVPLDDGMTTNFVARILTFLIILTNGRRILLLVTIMPSLQLVTKKLFTGQKTAHILVRIDDIRFAVFVASTDVLVIPVRTPMIPAAPLTKVKVTVTHENGIVLVNVILLMPRKSARIVVPGSPGTSCQEGIIIPVLTTEVIGTRGRDLVIGRISLPENHQIMVTKVIVMGVTKVIVMGRRHVEEAEGTDPGTVAAGLILRLLMEIIEPSRLLGLPDGVVILDDDIVTVSKLVISTVVRLSIVSW